VGARLDDGVAVKAADPAVGVGERRAFNRGRRGSQFNDRRLPVDEQVLDLQLHPANQHAGQPAERRIDELLVFALAPRQRVGALDRPVNVIGAARVCGWPTTPRGADFRTR
jgi:hypothetical protein